MRLFKEARDPGSYPCSYITVAETGHCSGDIWASGSQTTALVTFSGSVEDDFIAGPCPRSCLSKAHNYGNSTPGRMSMAPRTLDQPTLRVFISNCHEGWANWWAMYHVAQAPRGLNSVGNEILEGFGSFVRYTRANQMENRNPVVLSSNSTGWGSGVSNIHKGGNGCRLLSVFSSKLATLNLQILSQ